MTNWREREIDAAYLLDSGILFEINRSLLHQIGMALTVKKDENGKLVFNIKDCRETPEQLTFDKETYERGHNKLRAYMREYGYSQLDRRSKLLGWSSQSWFVPDNKRYKK